MLINYVLILLLSMNLIVNITITGHLISTFAYIFKLKIKKNYRLTSSADCAMKKPTVFAGILAPRGFIEI